MKLRRLNNKKVNNKLRSAFPSLTPADIYMTIIFIILFIGALAALQMYSSIESMNRLTHLNFNQIITWQKISQRMKFFIDTRENRVESDVLIRKIQKDLASLINKSESQYQEIEKIFKASQQGLFYQFNLIHLDKNYLQLITVDPELKLRAQEVKNAPLSLVRTNFDYWPIPITNAIQSDRYITPLYKNAELLAQKRQQQFNILYLASMLIFGVATLGIAMVWLGFLRPTVKKLSDARADTEFILNNAPGYICSYNPEGMFMSANQSYLDLVGAESLVVLKNKHISEFIGTENWKKIKNHVEKASKGTPIEFDVQMKLSGIKHVLMVSYRPKLAVDGTVTAIVAMIMDITDRYQAEHALRLSEENLRITLNSIGDGVIVTDIDGHIVRMNPQASRLAGCDEEDAKSLVFSDVFRILNTKTRQAVTPSIIQANKHTEQLNGLLLQSNNGDEYQITVSSSPINNQKGKKTGLVLVIRDMTEEYLLNQKLAQSEKLQSIGQLAGGIAHDFNNILAGIQGSVDLIGLKEIENEPEEKEKFIGYINRLIHRGTGLTERLTAFARIKESSFQPVNMNTLVRDSLAMVENTSDRRITFEFEDHSTNAIVFGSDSALQSAILNILINAVDAIKETGRVRVVIKNTDSKQTIENIMLGAYDSSIKYLSIEITDTGEGISQKDLSSIFDPFFTTKEVGKGVGLGLSATYGTMQDHNGIITLHSKEHEGSVFGLLLPQCR